MSEQEFPNYDVEIPEFCEFPDRIRSLVELLETSDADPKAIYTAIEQSGREQAQYGKIRPSWMYFKDALNFGVLLDPTFTPRSSFEIAQLAKQGNKTATAIWKMYEAIHLASELELDELAKFIAKSISVTDTSES